MTIPASPGGLPRRIQLSRRKGWRKPENTVVVARPSKWGNPFPIADLGRAQAIAAFRAMLDDPATRAALGYPEPEEIREQLAGKNLACWCPLDQPCHADILLEVANGRRR
ncbi:DUF4326 domain-containing protein [Leifsonia shinshuensis]|uniref:DUF4326 domain-containing protein n=1 Tax=Leifsonia shinshuensis TaxID=150026 RepID=UPI0028615546|nr:DUF4326 domain-containing protein [Leifsonia shinshuensis]MDR6971242.1 hypothetical protein [Leifsonia shinshuensis]